MLHPNVSFDFGPCLPNLLKTIAVKVKAIGQAWLHVFA
jgi:hypothetical protein